jgi:hypothetical protein
MTVVGLSYAQDILLIDLVTLSLFFSLLGGLLVGAITAIFTFFISGKQAHDCRTKYTSQFK